MGLLDAYKDQIQKLCETHKVKTLYAFGSVNTTDFSADSDVDLLVDFDTNDPIEYSDNYFGLKFALENILDRSIDLLEKKAIRNSFLRENIDKSKILIYGQ